MLKLDIVTLLGNYCIVVKFKFKSLEGMGQPCSSHYVVSTYIFIMPMTYVPNAEQL